MAEAERADSGIFSFAPLLVLAAVKANLSTSASRGFFSTHPPISLLFFSVGDAGGLASLAGSNQTLESRSGQPPDECNEEGG